MDTFVIRIETGNAAFEDFPGIEVARLLRKTADAIDSCGGVLPDELTIMDVNGNKVGAATYTEGA